MNRACLLSLEAGLALTRTSLKARLGKECRAVHSRISVDRLHSRSRYQQLFACVRPARIALTLHPQLELSLVS